MREATPCLRPAAQEVEELRLLVRTGSNLCPRLLAGGLASRLSGVTALTAASKARSNRNLGCAGVQVLHYLDAVTFPSATTTPESSASFATISWSMKSVIVWP